VFAPSPSLPRKRGREQIELAARADFFSGEGGPYVIAPGAAADAELPPTHFARMAARVRTTRAVATSTSAMPMPASE
jgi:hypothetical protein